MRLALFDVDGTLLTGPSAERRFIRFLLVKRRIGPRQAVAMAAFALVYAARYGRHVFKKDKAYLTGLRVDDVAALAREFVGAELVPALYAPACERLAEHLSAGDKVVLLTGAPGFLAKPLARHLGVDEICATVCQQSGERFGWRAPLQHPFGAEKDRLALRLAQETGLPLETAFAYADSMHDITLLATVGKPVAVRPDPALRSRAGMLGWEVLGESSETIAA